MRTVSGLDVHKDSIFMCILDEQGKKTEEKFGVTTREIKRLGAVMKSRYVSDVCMESTSIYWMPIWRLLESDFRLHLVNPLFLKQLLLAPFCEWCVAKQIIAFGRHASTYSVTTLYTVSYFRRKSAPTRGKLLQSSLYSYCLSPRFIRGACPTIGGLLTGLSYGQFFILFIQRLYPAENFPQEKSKINYEYFVLHKNY